MIPPPIPEVSDFIETLDLPLQPLTRQVRALILSTLPQAEEQFKWKVPFYYLHGPLCYLTPGEGGMVIGFIRGVDMSDYAGVFTAKDRKQVRHVSLLPEKQLLPFDDLRAYLIEASMINEERAK